MLMNTIITIGRQFGSAGREIGEKVAEYFGIKCYDKELLSRAAKESGFCEEMIQNHDERPTNSFLYNLVMDTYSFGYNASSFGDMPISHKVFLAQFDTIKKIASFHHVEQSDFMHFLQHETFMAYLCTLTTQGYRFQ